MRSWQSVLPFSLGFVVDEASFEDLATLVLGQRACLCQSTALEILLGSRGEEGVGRGFGWGAGGGGETRNPPTPKTGYSQAGSLDILPYSQQHRSMVGARGRGE